MKGNVAKVTVVLLLMAVMAGSVQAEVVLTMAGWGGTPDIKGFEALHPGVKIEYQLVPGSYNFIEQATVWALGGALPDIVLIPYWGIPTMAENGILRDITEFATRDQAWTDSFFPGSLQAFEHNEKLYGVPWLVGPMSIVYNPDLFAEQGLGDPMGMAMANAWTANAFIDSARKLTRHSPQGSFERIGMYSFTNQLNFVAPLIWALDGDVLGPDGVTVLLHQPSSIRALERLAELYGQEQVFLSRQQLGQHNLDVNQVQYGPSTAMRLTWNVEYESVRRNGVPVNIAPIPQSISGQPTDLIITHGIGISSQTEHADLAWEYIKYALSDVPLNLEFPARQEHFAQWAEHHQHENGWDAFQYISLVSNSIRLAPNPLNRDLDLILVRNLDQALRGQKPVEVAVQEIARQVQARFPQ